MHLWQSTLLVLSLGVAPMATSRANSLMLVDGSGRAVGYLLGSDTCSTNGYGYEVVSKFGYYACIAPNGPISVGLLPLGMSSFVLYEQRYESANCTGQPQVCSNGNMYGGFVVRTDGQLVMVAPGTIGPYVSTSSEGPQASCSVFPSPQMAYCVPAVANNPAISGLASARYKEPFHAAALPDAALDDVIFFDEFDFVY